MVISWLSFVCVLCDGTDSPCLAQDSDTDVYTLSLRTYARALAGHKTEARAGLTQLKDRATRREGLMFWQNSGEMW